MPLAHRQGQPTPTRNKLGRGPRNSARRHGGFLGVLLVVRFLFGVPRDSHVLFQELATFQGQGCREAGPGGPEEAWVGLHAKEVLCLGDSDSLSQEVW